MKHLIKFLHPLMGISHPYTAVQNILRCNQVTRCCLKRKGPGEQVCHKCFKVCPELVLGLRKDCIFFFKSELQLPTLPSDGADLSREHTLGLTGVYTFESSLWNRCFYFIFSDF